MVAEEIRFLGVLGTHSLGVDEAEESQKGGGGGKSLNHLELNRGSRERERGREERGTFLNLFLIMSRERSERKN